MQASQKFQCHELRTNIVVLECAVIPLCKGKIYVEMYLKVTFHEMKISNAVCVVNEMFIFFTSIIELIY